MTKMTYVDALNVAIDSMTDPAVIEKLTALRESIIKRNAKPSKPTPKQTAKATADEAMAQTVLDVLRNASEPLTVTAIKDSHDDFADVKVQKLSAIVRKLLLDGAVKRDEVKHKAVFSIA